MQANYETHACIKTASSPTIFNASTHIHVPACHDSARFHLCSTLLMVYTTRHHHGPRPRVATSGPPPPPAEVSGSLVPQEPVDFDGVFPVSTGGNKLQSTCDASIEGSGLCHLRVEALCVRSGGFRLIVSIIHWR